MTYPYENLDKHLTLPPEARKSWRFDTDDRHWQLVDCRVAAEHGECLSYTEGHVVQVPHDRALQAHATFLKLGYTFTPVDANQPGHTAWYFPPEQRCFQAAGGEPHRVRLEEIPAQLTVVPGDHRGYDLAETRVHTSGDSWMDDLHEHTDRLVQAQSGAPGLAPGAPVPATVNTVKVEG